MTKDSPILFSGQMVNAILKGEKICTRRVVLPLPFNIHWNYVMCDDVKYVNGKWRWLWGLGNGFVKQIVERKCRYGGQGTRLWVRETWSPIGWEYPKKTVDVQYRADGAEKKCSIDGYKCPWYNIAEKSKWKPSIFMPRWASRLTLEVESVRVERLQDMRAGDAESEGFNTSTDCLDNLADFRELWDKLNVKRGFGWAVNPYVFVIKFHRVEESKR